MSRYSGLIVVLLFALLARGLFLYEVWDIPYRNTIPEAFDQYKYHLGAEAFADGDWLAQAHRVEHQRTDYNKFAPLYKYFLGTVYRVTGVEPSHGRIAQLLLGVVTSLLVYGIGRRLLGEATGILASVLYSLYGPVLFHEFILARASFTTFLTTLLLYLLVLHEQTPPKSVARLGWYLLSALLFSLCIQSRPNLLIALPLILIALIRADADRRLWRRLAHAAGFVALAAVLTLPMLYRGHQVHGFPTLSTQGPNVFRYSNEPTPEHEQPGWNLPPVHYKYGYGEVIGIVWKAMVERPGDFARLWAMKIRYLFNGYEVASNHSYYIFAAYSHLLQPGGWNFALLLGLAATGVVATVNTRTRLNTFYWVLAGHLISIVVFYIASRFRIPTIPLLAILAAAGLHGIVVSLGAKRFVRAAALLLLAAGVAGLNWSAPPKGVVVQFNHYGNLADMYLTRYNESTDATEDLIQSAEFYERAWDASVQQAAPHSPYRLNLIAVLFRLTQNYAHVEDRVGAQKMIDWIERLSGRLPLSPTEQEELKTQLNSFRKQLHLAPG